MDYWHLLLDLPAVVGGATMISLLSPWRMQARAVPVVLFVVGLLVMFLPVPIVAALALMLPVALVQRLMGIELHGHEPMNINPAIEKARSAAQAARERVRKPEPVEPMEVTTFAAQAYPAPGIAAEAGHDDADSDTASTSATEAHETTAAKPGEKFDWRKRLHEVEQARAANVGRRVRVMPESGVRP
jgi:hypothetical protein